MLFNLCFTLSPHFQSNTKRYFCNIFSKIFQTLKKLKNLIIIFKWTATKYNNKIKQNINFILKISLTFRNTTIYKCFVENNVKMEIILSRHPATDIAFFLSGLSLKIGISFRIWNEPYDNIRTIWRTYRALMEV